MFTLKDKDRVLNRLLALRNPETGYIYKPIGLLRSFPPLTSEDCSDILDVLEDEGLITVQTADYPESDNIWTIELEPAAFSYFQYKDQENKENRKQDRRWRITLAIAIIGAVTGIAGLLISWLK